MSIFVGQEILHPHQNSSHKKSVPKINFFIQIRPAHQQLESVGQNANNQPPVASKQFFDPMDGTRASFIVIVVPPNLQTTLPESIFDHTLYSRKSDFLNVFYIVIVILKLFFQ